MGCNLGEWSEKMEHESQKTAFTNILKSAHMTNTISVSLKEVKRVQRIFWIEKILHKTLLEWRKGTTETN